MSQIPLRKRYYRDVVRMGALILLVCVGVLTAFNAVEYWEHREESSEELIEMIVLFAALMATFPVVIWLAWRTSGRLLRPLQDIQQSVQDIRQGNLDRRVAAEGAEDELAYLVESLNQAFDAHRSAQKRLQQFSSDVSHQLRTPLTAMSTQGQCCLSKPRSPGEYREVLGQMLEQADHLSKVIDQLLMLAKISASGAEPAFGRLDLAELTEGVFNEFRPYFEDRDAGLELRRSREGLWMQGNVWWLGEALRNLINNALQYTPDPARFRISLFSEADRVGVRLEDSGPGIPAALRERIFERFQRGTQEGDHGTGLGLAIVQEVVRLHGGSLLLEDSDLGGCAFSLVFPFDSPPLQED